MIEFLAKPNGPPYRPEPWAVDRRYAKATGQYIAAASFGPLQATLNDYDHTGREPILRTVLDLREPPAGTLDKDQKCLQDVNDPANLDMALKLGAVRHSSADQSYNPSACAYGVCDQQDWTKRWMEVVKSYNPADSKYSAGSDGLNEILRNAIKTYFPRLIF